MAWIRLRDSIQAGVEEGAVWYIGVLAWGMVGEEDCIMCWLRGILDRVEKLLRAD